jgi:hypothetical protein
MIRRTLLTGALLALAASCRSAVPAHRGRDRERHADRADAAHRERHDQREAAARSARHGAPGGGVVAIAQGSYVGTTAVPQPDGTLLAKEVHIFTEAQRGTGRGPLSDGQSGRHDDQRDGIPRVGRHIRATRHDDQCDRGRSGT